VFPHGPTVPVKEPREILKRVNRFREMPRHGEYTFCCGGGGAKEIVVACPFCYAMLSNAARGLNLENFKIKEITETLGKTIMILISW